MEDKKLTLHEVVAKIIGPIYPVGETNEDNRRLANLKVMTRLTNNLVEDIKEVSDEKNSYMWSLKEAGRFAHDFLANELGIKEQ